MKIFLRNIASRFSAYALWPHGNGPVRNSLARYASKIPITTKQKKNRLREPGSRNIQAKKAGENGEK